MLQRRSIELLTLFVRHPDELFTREALTQRLWPDVHVSDHALTQSLFKLRQALEDGEDALPWIQTVHGRGYRFVGEVVQESPSGPSPSVQTSLDQFVGREDELQQLARELSAHRLVNIVGPAGTGKTRLAREWILRGTPVPTSFVDLSTALTEDALVQATARTIGAGVSDTPRESLGVALKALGPHVLVLDNVEQLIDSVEASVVSWLAAATSLRVLCTSRRVLRCTGERILMLAPLTDEQATTLFRTRVATQATDEELLPLIRALDALPLAIELVAPRARLFPIDGLISRLADRFEILKRAGSEDRHAGLDAALAHSWMLLDAPLEKALIELATFRAPFLYEDARGVLGEGALDKLQDLVDHSLVQARKGRFALLNSVRDFARDRAGPDRWSHALNAHCTWFAAFGVRERCDAMNHERDGERFGLSHLAVEDLQAAAEHALTVADSDRSANAACAVWQVIRRTGPVAAGAALLQRALAQRGADELRLLHATGQAWALSGQAARSVRIQQELLAKAERQGETRWVMCAHLSLSYAYNGLQDAEASREAATRCAEAARAVPDAYCEGLAHLQLANLARNRGEKAQASQQGFTAAKAFERETKVDVRATRLGAIAAAEFDAGELAASLLTATEALEQLRADGDRVREVQFGQCTVDILTELGDRDAARAAATKYLALAREVGRGRMVSMLEDQLLELMEPGQLGTVAPSVEQ